MILTLHRYSEISTRTLCTSIYRVRHLTQPPLISHKLYVKKCFKQELYDIRRNINNINLYRYRYLYNIYIIYNIIVFYSPFYSSFNTFSKCRIKCYTLKNLRWLSYHDKKLKQKINYYNVRACVPRYYITFVWTFSYNKHLRVIENSRGCLSLILYI